MATYNFLFPRKYLQDLDTSEWATRYGLSCTVNSPGDGLIIRPLAENDYQKGFLEVLEELTQVGEVSEQSFKERFQTMQSCKDTFFVIVAEDTRTQKVIGTATLIVEQRFIWKCSLRGRVDDMVVNDVYMGKGLGKLLLATATDLGKNLGCYKISLECLEDTIAFYGKCGFKPDPQGNHYLVQRFRRPELVEMMSEDWLPDYWCVGQ